MTTLRQLRRRAAALGAIVVDDVVGHTHECTVEAPPGHVWVTDGLHMFVAACYSPWRPDYADLLSRMAAGVEPCTDPDCEWCHPDDN